MLPIFSNRSSRIDDVDLVYSGTVFVSLTINDTEEVTLGCVYRSPNINQEHNNKLNQVIMTQSKTIRKCYWQEILTYLILTGIHGQQAVLVIQKKVSGQKQSGIVTQGSVYRNQLDIDIMKRSIYLTLSQYTLKTILAIQNTKEKVIMNF